MSTKYYIYKLFNHKKTLHVRALIGEILYLGKIEKEIVYRKEKIFNIIQTNLDYYQLLKY